MPNFTNLSFYYGDIEDYTTLKNNNALDNCFYYVKEMVNNEEVYKLFLHTKQIMLSTEIQDYVQIATNEYLSDKMSNYVQTDALLPGEELEEQIINSDITITKNLTVDNIVANGNINASNFQNIIENNQITKSIIPNNLEVSGDINAVEIISGNSTLSSESELSVKQLNFVENASIVNMPTINIENGQNNFQYDFKSGIFKINRLEAESIKGTLVDGNTQSLQVVSLQIGNILLTDDNGNLKITVIKSASNNEGGE